MTTASATTNHRILIAVLKLLAYGDLARRGEVERLASQPNQDRMNRLTHYYIGLAEKINFDLNGAEHRGPHLAPERLVTCFMFAADLAYRIRRAAQGARGADPSRYIWCLLNAVLTVLYLTAHTPDERTRLDQQVNLVAHGLGE